MPTKYQRKPGSRRYVNYTEIELAECLHAIRSNQMTQRAAAARYKIPWSTIKNKLKSKFGNKPGRPTIFSVKEENAFVAHIIALSEYGFPLTSPDIKMLIRDYLSEHSRVVPQFNGNTPGKDWLQSFLKRNKVLSLCLAKNIQKNRTRISKNVITDFIEYTRRELAEVPAENIYNYHELSLSDNPDKNVIICRREAKYSEALPNANKVNFTVTFCGNAIGQEIPPFIIYRSDHVWSKWTVNGPENARYDRTNTGWMNTVTFENWFINHLIPILRTKTGRKVVIGDHLSSHISPTVLSECQEHNISFICLPPNSTHIFQPLDAAYFQPLKCKWRQVLLNWKCHQSEKTLLTVPTYQFPRLLTEALSGIAETKENLIAGFKKTGIFPVDSEQPLSRLSRQNRICNSDLVEDSFTNIYQEKCVKKRKLNASPRHSSGSVDLEDAGPSGRKQSEIRKRRRVGKVKRESASEIDFDSSSEDDMSIYNVKIDFNEKNPKHEYISDEEQSNYEDENVEYLDLDENSDPSPIFEENVERDRSHNTKDSAPLYIIKVEELTDSNSTYSHVGMKSEIKTETDNYYSEGDYVLVLSHSEIYPGQITLVSEEGAFVSCLKKGKTFWRWPVIKDEQLYSWNEMICKIDVPKLEKKGCFSIRELD